MARRIVAALIVLATLGVIGAVLLSQRSQPPSFEKLSNRGTAAELDLPPTMPGPLSGLTGDAFLLAEREDLRFYRLPHARGLACYAMEKRRETVWLPDGMGCFEHQFPSRARPLLDFSSVEASVERPHPHFLYVAGIAADAVDRIAVIDADNRVVPAVDVVDNVYFTRRLPKGDFFGLAALDGDGKVVWRDPPSP